MKQFLVDRKFRIIEYKVIKKLFADIISKMYNKIYGCYIEIICGVVNDSNFDIFYQTYLIHRESFD